MAQYPLNMGRSQSGPQHTGTLALNADADGNIKYDMILKQGAKGKELQTTFKDSQPMDVADQGYARPSEEEVQETAERTRAALEKIVDCEFFFVCRLSRQSRSRPVNLNNQLLK